MSAPSTRLGRDAHEEELTSLAVMEVQESSFEGDRDTSAEELASLVVVELGESSREGEGETLEEEPVSLAVMEVQELSLPSRVSQLRLREKEEEKGKPEPSTPEHPGALLPAAKEAADSIVAVGSHPPCA